MIRWRRLYGGLGFEWRYQGQGPTPRTRRSFHENRAQDDNDPLVQAFPTPALRKVREGRGTHFVGDTGEIRSLTNDLLYIRNFAVHESNFHVLVLIDFLGA